MKTIIIAAFYILASISNTPGSVYYCDSPTGKKYHQSKQCRGLKKCTHTVKTISLKEAEKMGLTQCQIEK
jgi:hypothetical protein